MPRETVPEAIGRMIATSGKTQREIAREIGWPRPNFLSMLKNGESKMPVDRAPALARACGESEIRFLSLVLREQQPDLWNTLRTHYRLIEPEQLDRGPEAG